MSEAPYDVPINSMSQVKYYKAYSSSLRSFVVTKIGSSAECNQQRKL